jgi:intracellular sulfur oxidation DsrE/DsrF family protein
MPFCKSFFCRSFFSSSQIISSSKIYSMDELTLQPKSDRREFLSSFALSAAALGLGSLSSLSAIAGEQNNNHMYADADEWFSKVKGKHKIVFDVPEPKDIFPFAWPRVFLLTNEKTGTPTKDCGVVVILRHAAIGYAMESRLWEKYKFGEFFNAPDPKTKAPATRNPFWEAKADDFVLPGVGPLPIAINDLQASGVMFCVCDAALTVYSAVKAQAMGQDAAAVKQDWVSGLLPGVQVVPSGVWAVGRAQEKGCAYCFAG